MKNLCITNVDSNFKRNQRKSVDPLGSSQVRRDKPDLAAYNGTMNPAHSNHPCAKPVLITLVTVWLLAASAVEASELPDREQLRFRSQSYVTAKLGEPDNKSTPIGTHAEYTLWYYPNFVVAFANGRVIHLFAKDSLHRITLND